MPFPKRISFKTLKEHRVFCHSILPTHQILEYDISLNISAVDSCGSAFGAKPQVPVIQDVGGEERSFSDALGALDHDIS